MKFSWLISLSNGLMRVERSTCGLLVALVTALILLNVTTRAFSIALFWVDELAVYMMIWMALIGASVLLRERRHVAVTLLTGVLAENRQHALLVLVDVMVLAFAGGLFLMCLAWYDPAGLVSYGFDIEEFAASKYNFIYQEPTNTLGVPKFWVWLVVPIVSINMSLHAIANLLEDVAKGKRG
ncbi:MAG: TRAP transporter small permease subunit [Gammaproteobacteria bacterium]|nr:TRAP transporter small permease subunit [Gammaproteobacteria bacterium]